METPHGDVNMSAFMKLMMDKIIEEDLVADVVAFLKLVQIFANFISRVEKIFT